MDILLQKCEAMYIARNELDAKIGREIISTSENDALSQLEEEAINI